MSIDPNLFRSALGRFASGVTVLTTRDEAGEDHGMTVSAFCSASLEPPLVLACIDRQASLHDILARASHFGISILSAAQEAIARRFAEWEGDRFQELGFTRGGSGVALLHDALAHLECRIRERLPGGDHTIHLGEVEAAEVFTDRPLLYYRGGYAQLER